MGKARKVDAVNDYPKEVQALLDAAVAWDIWTESDEFVMGGGAPVSELLTAIENYRESIAPPEPFTAYVGQTLAGRTSDFAWPRLDSMDTFDHVWEVRVEFVRKVR